MNSNVAYLYNGVQLPPLPTVDAKYQYLLIVNNGGVTTLLACKTAPFAGRTNDGRVSLNSDSSVSFTPYELAEDGSAWEAVGKEYFFGGSVGGRVVPIIWVNFDLLNEDGSVYLAASEPVPVYGHMTNKMKCFVKGIILGLMGTPLPILEAQEPYVYDPDTGLLVINRDDGSLNYNFNQQDFSLQVTEV